MCQVNPGLDGPDCQSALGESRGLQELNVDEDRQPTKNNPGENTGGRTNTSASRDNHFFFFLV